MENKFEGAKIGDKFVCRDGAIAEFMGIKHSNDFDSDFAILKDDVYEKNQHYHLNGQKCPNKELDADIVEKYTI